MISGTRASDSKRERLPQLALSPRWNPWSLKNTTTVDLGVDVRWVVILCR